MHRGLLSHLASAWRVDQALEDARSAPSRQFNPGRQPFLISGEPLHYLEASMLEHCILIRLRKGVST